MVFGRLTSTGCTLNNSQIREVKQINESDTSSSTITTTLRDELGLASVNTHKYDLTVYDYIISVNTADGSFTNATPDGLMFSIGDVGENVDNIPIIITPTGSEKILGDDGVRIMNIHLYALSNKWYVR